VPYRPQGIFLLLRDDDSGDDWKRAPLPEFESHLHDEEHIVSDSVNRQVAHDDSR
jgi:hypothetical protein